MANLAIAATLVGRGDLVIEDRLNHASLLDSGLASGARLLRYRHADAGAAARLLERPARRRLVMTDGVFSMDGDRAPLTGLIGACDRHDAWLSVDDAHGFGVLGPGGRGTLELLPDRGQSIPVLMATLGKALGSFGAFVAGSRDLIEVLVQRARTYIYTTALPPAVAAAAQRAVEIAREEPWRRSHVLELAARFQRGARSLGLGVAASETPIQPLLIGDERSTVEASAALLEAGCLVPAIRPPTVPSGSSRLRITFSAAHSTADVDRLLDVLSDWQARPRAVAAQ
jgi:8-amino-7-oxononanoate synthase